MPVLDFSDLLPAENNQRPSSGALDFSDLMTPAPAAEAPPVPPMLAPMMAGGEATWQDGVPVGGVGSAPAVAPSGPKSAIPSVPQPSFLTPMIQGLTFGFGDEIQGAVRGGMRSLVDGVPFAQARQEETDASRARLEGYREENPKTAIAAEMGGAILPFLLTRNPAALEAVGTGAGRAVATVAPNAIRTQRVATGVAEGMASGAVSGAAYGAGTAEGDVFDRAKAAVPSAALGATVGGAFGGAVGGVTGQRAVRAAQESIPETAAVRQSATDAYNRAASENVIFSRAGIQQMRSDVRQALAGASYSRRLHPGVRSVLGEIDDLLQAPNVTWDGIRNVRRLANDVASGSGREEGERRVGREALRVIDGYLENTPAGVTLPGSNVAAANAAEREGRNLWSRARRSQTVDELREAAELRTASTGQGANENNVTRQNVRKILGTGKQARGFTEAERAAANTVVRGRPLENAARQLGAFAPTGLVSTGGSVGLGSLVGNMVAGPAGAMVGGAVLPAIGAGARRFADRATRRNAERLSEVVRTGGRTAEQIAASAARNAPGADPALVQILRRQERRLGKVAGAFPATFMGGMAGVSTGR